MYKYILKLCALAVTAVMLLGGCSDISRSESSPLPADTETAPVIHVISPGDTTTVRSAAPVPEDTEPDIERYHRRLSDIREENGVYGMSVAVFKDGDIIYTDCLGLADMDREIACTKNTRFRAASVSKLISTILVMKMCDEGAITLQSNLKTATGLPFNTAGNSEVKLWHLLTHTACVTDTYLFELAGSEKYSAEYILKNSLTGFQPGTFYNYSNFGAGLMGAVIERITGMYFHDYAEKVLFEPLGMDAGYIIDLIEDKQSCAVIYDHDGEVFNVPEWRRNRTFYESFGLGNSYLSAQCELLITPSDLARLGTALAGDGTVKECGGKRILSEEAIEQMHTSYIETEYFGMGLNVRIYDGDLVAGRTIYGHPGNALGSITGLFYDRTDGTGVAIMTNRCNYGTNSGSGLYRFLHDTVNETYRCFFGA